MQSASSRISLLSELAELASQRYHYILANQGWTTLIVGDSPPLQRKPLEEDRLKDCHLAPLRRYSFDENYIVLDATCPSAYSWSRSESILYAVWSDDFGKLLLHEEYVIRRVRELGHQWVIKTQDELIENERLEAVYGRS